MEVMMQDLLTLALEAVAQAHKVIMQHYQKALTVEWKPDATPVTIADKGAEEVMREFLLKRDAGFGFVGEEFGCTTSKNGYTWIMDPIDGTKSFIYGVPLFGTLLALMEKGEPVVGIIALPALNSVLYAAKGLGCFCDGKPVKTSAVTHLADSLVLSGTVNTFEARGHTASFTKLRQSARLYRGWGDCYGYYQVAQGRAEVMCDPVVSLWDIAPMPIIFSEAGGRFSALDGKSYSWQEADFMQEHVFADQYSGCVATNGLIHKKVIEFFA
jgi:histidinol-phosphatase